MYKKRKSMRRRSLTKNKILIISSMCLLLCICVGYAAFETNISITAKGNVVKNVRVIQSWDNLSKSDFHSDFYKENIVSITFLDNNNIPTEATDSWNVSEDQENGAVMAWVVPNSSDNTKYDLYIGAPAGVIANEDSSYIFYNFTAVEFIDFNNNYDTSNVTNMRSMFHYCSSLTELDLSSFDTSNVTRMDNMFYMWDETSGVSIENKLTNIIFGNNFDTSSVVRMGQMFIGCNNLSELDVANWDVHNVEYFDAMFAFCSSLEELDLSKWDTSSAISMGYMFKHCTNLVLLNLSGFDTTLVTTMYQMFYGVSNLTSLNLCSFDTSNVINMGGMFQYTSSLQVIYAGSGWTTVGVTITDMFSDSNISSVTTGQC